VYWIYFTRIEAPEGDCVITNVGHAGASARRLATDGDERSDSYCEILLRQQIVQANAASGEYLISQVETIASAEAV
jgi:hypothetical protein